MPSSCLKRVSSKDYGKQIYPIRVFTKQYPDRFEIHRLSCQISTATPFSGGKNGRGMKLTV
jgi:hypothetical protein